MPGTWIGTIWSFFMKAILGCTALVLAIGMATLPANAKGCIKGAIVGGAAGHVAGHHGLMGRRMCHWPSRGQEKREGGAIPALSVAVAN
jgi:hypothetical protein